MTIRVAINGFGRIGRNVLRAAWHRKDIEFVHINDLTSDEMLAYLLSYDSVHGRFGTDIRPVDGGISIDGKVIATSSERDPARLPWADKDIDVVMECTGVFVRREDAAKHLDAGAKKVLISAPGKGVDATIVYGVNHDIYDGSAHTIVSNASCTTNCLAPVVQVLNQKLGLEHGMVTTVHSYTMDQNILDAPHRKGKFRRARAAAVNMVPTTTGAAAAIGVVLPEMAGKLHGMAIRVPTPDVSLVDLVFRTSRDTTIEEVNQLLTAASQTSHQGVLGVTCEPLVSSDLIGNPDSSIVDLQSTDVIGSRLVKIISWYDNEWGFSNRMSDLALYMVNTK